MSLFTLQMQPYSLSILSFILIVQMPFILVDAMY